MRMLLLFLEVVLLLQAISIHTAAFTSERQEAVSFSAPCKNKQCVVVGGGPIGLAAALTLSRPPHSYSVTVLERSEGDTSVSAYDASRSYLYNVNSRGLEWFKTAPNCAMAKLQERGYSPEGSMGNIVRIPADPKKPIDPPKVVTMPGKIDVGKRTNYWIPRHQMVELLLQCCQEENEKSGINRIEVLSGKEVESVTPNADDTIQVQCKDGSTYIAGFAVAADGIDSAVRSCLADTNANTWLQSNPKKFKVKKYKSPSTGIKLKALQLPPNFTLINTDGSTYPTISSTIYTIRGDNKGSRNMLSLGLLPMKDPTMIRPANTNTPYDHEIWSLKTVAEAKAWFSHCFPRIQWDTLVDDAEWERFIKAKGTTFPHCQYSEGSAVSAPDGLTGVVMVGDACHAFPPDIGQGINAGLLDVVALDHALSGQEIETGQDLETKPTNLGVALENYQRNRGPEHRALIRLARFGVPYQYSQPWKRHRIGKFLWTANVAFRLLLNKISFGLIQPTCIILMTQNHELSFRQIMRRADTTALILKLLGLAIFVRFFALKFAAL